MSKIGKNLPIIQETWIQSLDEEDALVKGMQPTPVFSPGEFLAQRSLKSPSPWGQSQTPLSN